MENYLVRTRNYTVDMRNYLVGTRKYWVCTGYLVRTGEHPVHFSLLYFCVEMTVLVYWKPLYGIHETWALNSEEPEFLVRTRNYSVDTRTYPVGPQ